MTADQTSTVPIANARLNTNSDVSSKTGLNATQAVTLAKTTEGDVLPEMDSKDASNIAPKITHKTALKVTSVTTDKRSNSSAGDTLKPVDNPVDKVSANKVPITPTLVAVTDAGSSGDETHAKSILTEDLSSLPKK